MEKKNKNNFYQRMMKRWSVRFIRKIVFMSLPFYLSYKLYIYMLQNNPKKLREKLTDKFLYDEYWLKKSYLNKSEYFDFFKLLSIPLEQNMIPPADVNEEKLEFMKCKLFGKEFSHPIGLDVGYDMYGSWCLNLSKLGVEYLMLGPYTDIFDNSFTYDREIPKQRLDTLPNLPLDYALTFLTAQLKQIKESNMKHIGMEVYVSMKSHTIVPYLLEKKLSSLMDGALSFADSVNIEIGNVNDPKMSKYRDPSKLRLLLDRLKNIYCRTLAIQACAEFELMNGFSLSPNSISKRIMPLISILRKKPANVIIRISDEIPLDDFGKILFVIQESGIVNAIILDAENDKKLYDGREDYNISKAVLTKSNEKLHLIRNLLGEDFPIISAGAIFTGEDVFERIKNGADFVLIGKALQRRGPYVFEKIIGELSDIMFRKNIKNLKEIRKLSDINRIKEFEANNNKTI